MRPLIRFCVGLAASALGLALSLGSSAVAADIVAVVSADSPVTDLRASDVADIFLGKMNRLPGGAVAVPIDLPEGSPTRDAFYTAFTGKSPAQLRAHWSKIIFTGRGQPPKEVANGAALKHLVAGDPSAIGYLDSSEVDDSVRVVAPR